MGFLSWALGGIGSMIGGPAGAAIGSTVGNFLGDNAGSIMSGAGSLFNAFSNRQAANTARDFAASQSATQHQREVVDLKAAGLNPVLSASYGGNASATSPMAPVPSANDAITSAMQMKQMDAQIRLLNEQARKTNIEGTLASKNAPIADAQAKILGQIMPSVTSSAAKVINLAEHPTSFLDDLTSGLSNSAKSITDKVYGSPASSNQDDMPLGTTSLTDDMPGSGSN